MKNLILMLLIATPVFAQDDCYEDGLDCMQDGSGSDIPPGLNLGWRPFHDRSRPTASTAATLRQCKSAKSEARALMQDADIDQQELGPEVRTANDLNCTTSCPASEGTTICDQQTTQAVMAFTGRTNSPPALPVPDDTSVSGAEGSAPAPGTSAKFTHGGKIAPRSEASPARSCLPTLWSMESSYCNPTVLCGNAQSAETEDCVTTQNGIRRFKDPAATVDFQNLNSCQTYFGPSFQPGAELTVSDSLKLKTCRLMASGCPVPTGVSGDANIRAAQERYNTCVTSEQNAQQLRSVIVGVQKCAAIKSAGDGTTQFEEGARVSTIDGKITCKRNQEGLHFDYPSCKSFVTWYNGLVAAQTGVQLYNEGDKIGTGLRAQTEAAQAVATGNGQEAGIEASRKTIMASASAEERNKFFFTTKAVAITSQLATFVTKSNVGSSCDGNENCCALFDEGGNDGISNASSFFPNSGEKDKMIAEVIRAGGEAAIAAMREQELRRQAAALKAIKDQMTAPDDIVDDGVMRYCLQFPQDVKCLGPGNRVVSGGAAFRGPSFSGQNMGLGNLGTATPEELGVEEGSAGAIGGPENSIGDIGSADKGAADAKATFDAPSALRGGGGTPTVSGGGGAGASASANGLSNDAGVEGEKKETPLRMTSKSASYEGGAGYNGGGYRAGAGDKKDAAANPFASMFGKDKGRSPSAVTEIDSPASDLFTKISNRYGEVQKRKALMEVR